MQVNRVGQADSAVESHSLRVPQPGEVYFSDKSFAPVTSILLP